MTRLCLRIVLLLFSEAESLGQVGPRPPLVEPERLRDRLGHGMQREISTGPSSGSTERKWGDKRTEPTHVCDSDAHGWIWKLRDRKGGAIQEWPNDLRVREFPR